MIDEQGQWQPPTYAGAPQQSEWKPPEYAGAPAEPKKEEPKRVDEPWYMKLWHESNAPLTTLPGTLSQIANTIINPEQMAAHRDLYKAGEDFLNQQTSPISLALLGASGGESLLGEAAPAIAKGLTIARQAASVPYTIEGAHQVATGKTPAEKGLGAAEFVGGLLGTGLPSRFTRFSPVEPPKNFSVPDWLNTAKATEEGGSFAIPEAASQDVAPRGPYPQKQLTTGSPRLALPAIGETSGNPRFFHGPAGMADANMAYPYDLQDPLHPFRQTTSAEEPGVQQPSDIGPIAAANRTSLDIRDPAAMNPTFRALHPETVGTEPMGLQGVPKDIPEVVQEHPYGGKVVDEPKSEVPFNSNKVDVVNRTLSQFTHAPEDLAKHIDNNPSTAGARPVPDIINSTPVEPTSPSDVVNIRSGQAKPTDTPNNLWTYIDSTDKILSRYESTAPIAKGIIEAQDKKLLWINKTLRAMTPFLGANDVENQTIFNALDGKIDPTSLPEQMQLKVSGLRQILDSIHGEGPKDVGYLTDYISHMRERNSPLYDYFFGKDQPTGEAASDVTQPGPTTAIGTPGTPFTEPRTGALKDYSTDLVKVLRAYTAGYAKEIFDAPAVELAKKQLAAIPDTQPRLAALAQRYLQNYSQYDGEGQLAKELRGWADTVSNITANSILTLNPKFHMLHLGELPATVWPELGTRYASIGLKDVLTDLPNVTRDLARNGLLPNGTIPWAFKTTGEKLKMPANFLNAAEIMAKGTAFRGAMARAFDQGYRGENQLMKAIDETKRITLAMDPARMQRVLMSEGPVGNVFTKLGMQFKGTPMHLLELYTNAVDNFKQQGGGAKAMRYFLGGLLGAGGTAAGLHTFHAGWQDLLEPTLFGPTGDVLKQVLIKDLATNLDPLAALGHTIAWAIPGGKNVEQFIK